ncbi:zinc metalloproteinase nas-27-like [Hydractinia symbiolongicarpus]|uniref:zinc metalloproteinase nas-27-like n=1 Tax=Hydractinia symbiolongicarpus TaxID=13093 RepID=UPI0025514D2D|nr:zinc metalloproteinase nas-27-like [Hydractinia symbiolongicarpus]
MLLLLLLISVAVSAKQIDRLKDDSLNNIENELDELTKQLQSLQDQVTDTKQQSDDEDGEVMSKIAEANELADLDGMEEVDMRIDDQNNEADDKRNALNDRRNLWYMKDIAYFISGSLDAKSKQAIKDAHAEISAKSCIKFHQRTSADKYYLNYTKGSGCWSYVGLSRGRATTGQPISIGQGCGTKGIAIHETLHALGFYHEQSRFDRDEYVEIFWENIKTGKENNFKRRTRQNSDNLGTDYDYSGIMHYGKTAFSKNGKPTILSLKDPSQQLGQRNRLTQVDADQLYRLYECTNTKQGWSNWSGWHPCSSSCGTSRTRFCYSNNIGDCTGDSREFRQCTDTECKTDGHWGKWTLWTNCDASSCNYGKRTRSRQCNDPVPHHGGKTCQGQATVVGTCFNDCPTHCKFEESNLCQYTATGKWLLKTGGTPSRNTGPESGAYGSDMYVYLEASGIPPGSTHTLISPVFKSSSQACISFNYHMYGASMGSLELNLIQGNLKTQLFSESGDRGNQWKSTSKDFRTSRDYQLEFKGIVGRSFTSDIALDNLHVFDGPCNGKGS